MKNNIPQNIKELSQSNFCMLKANGIKRASLTKSLNISIEIGQMFLSKLFLENNIKVNFLKNEYKNRKQNISIKKDKIINEILMFDFDFIIVRPEMFHMTEKICSFLKKNKFKVNFLIEKKINIIEYFNLYKEIIIKSPNFKFVLPSRTLSYINGKSSIIFFTKSINYFSNDQRPLADLFSCQFKGREGIKSKNTIRGDIIYKEALRLGFDKITNPVIAMAIDPFLVYRKMVEERSGDFYHLEASSNQPLLLYTAQGIHCPNYSELSHDLASILNLKELLKLKNTFLK